MSKAFVAFELVALWDEIIFSHLGVDDAMKYHVILLDMCGWSETEYEEEVLARVDKEWTTLHREIVYGTSCLSN